MHALPKPKDPTAPWPAVDASGVWYTRRRRGILVPWLQVRAVGGGYWIRRVHGAGDVVIRAVTTDEGREYQAIEVFLRDDAVVKADRRLRGRWFDQQEAEAAPELVGGRLRFIFAGKLRRLRRQCPPTRA